MSVKMRWWDLQIYPVVMCGGSGSRLWPTSRPARPKQFASFSDELSLFQATVRRVSGLAADGRVIVVAGKAHRATILRQLQDIEVQALVLLEPEARDSGPAMAAAAAFVAGQDPDGILAVVASDHHIPSDADFRAAIRQAADAAAGGLVVTLGVRPTEPSSAYGYIRPSAGDPASPVLPVSAFVEKPTAERAESFLAAGYLWNSGNFVVGAQVMIDELNLHAPELASAVMAAVEGADHSANCVALGEAFRSAPKISIDYALMEKTARAGVLPVDFHWSDVGAWDAIWKVSPQDEDNNVVRGGAIVVNSKRCLVRNDSSQRIGLVGLENIAVIADDDALLVCNLGASQGVKLVVDQLNAIEAAEIDAPRHPTLHQWADRLGSWMRSTALPLWWTHGADFSAGGFWECLDPTAAPTAAPRRARVLARQAYTFAIASHSGWRGPWKEAALHATDSYLARFLMADGQFAPLVSNDGVVLQREATLYDQAFSLLALASVHRIAPERGDLLDHADRLRLRLEDRRLAQGGFIERGRWPYQANAHMHLLEAALLWYEVTGKEPWRALADEIVELARRYFIDPDGGFLREAFDETWAPAAGEDGKIVEPGHQFEWAWLLRRWGQLTGGRAEVGETIDALMSAGRRGIVGNPGYALDEIWDDFTIKSHRSRLWPQTEWLRATCATLMDAPLAGRDELLEEAQAAAAALWSFLQTPVPGLWWDKRFADGQFASEPSPASSLYHLLGAIIELEACAAKLAR